MVNDSAIQRLRESLDSITKDSNSSSHKTITAKEAVIRRYRPMFLENDQRDITKDSFLGFLLFKNNRHWTNLQRHGGSMTANMNRLRGAIRTLVDEDRPLKDRLNRLRPPDGNPMVKGMGQGVITGILQVCYPEKYGVLNNKTREGMKHLKLWPVFPRGASFGERYEILNGVLQEVAEKVGTDLWTLDMLWWRVVLSNPTDSESSGGNSHPREDNKHIDFRAIVRELNVRARTHPIGALQKIRAELKQLARQPGNDIFGPQTIFDDWACHLGGRTELQFNVGLEELEEGSNFRHGVAFSFQLNQTLPSIDILIPKVSLFNEFMRLYPDLYEDMRMWHWEGRKRSSDYMPAPVPHERVVEGVFIFLGKHQLVDRLDYEGILDDFDRLLPLYRYVQGSGVSQPTTQFEFRPGCSDKSSSAIASKAQKQLDVNLRHNDLQWALHRQLASRYGEDNVGTENLSTMGTRIDMVVRREDGYWFYEIKTASSPRACLREAIGQLLEYAFWPGAPEAIRLIVVGEAAIDKDGKEYLRCLNKRFSLPIEYEQLVV